MEKVTQLNEKYRVKSDNICLHLEEKSAVKDKESENYGSITWKPVSYHSNFKSLFSKLSWKETLENWGDFDAINKSLQEIKDIARKIDDNIG